jgi:hypothetical protein
VTAAFTPGPWARPDDDVYAVFAYPEGAAATIADCNSGHRVVQDDDECAANARLIAAAPDLFAACAEALAFVEEMEGKFDRHFLIGGKLFDALSKARGEANSVQDNHVGGGR